METTDGQVCGLSTGLLRDLFGFSSKLNLRLGG
jgi:hypothetical protein